MQRRRRIVWLIAVLLLVSLGGFGAWAEYLPAQVQVSTVPVTDGPIARVLFATGTVQPVEVVQVGAQVSGVVQSLAVDFNSLVRAGEVVARIDPESLQVQLKAAQAADAVAEANLLSFKAQVDDLRTQLNRAETLRASDLIAQSDFDDARVAFQEAQEGVRAGEASVAQTKAAVDQASVNLTRTVIKSPIDGIVIARNVDVGQSLSAAVDTPVLFTVAADFKRMQVQVNIDESDVGEVKAGEPVTFTVESYPGQIFHGTVRQVRLEPLTGASTLSPSLSLTPTPAGPSSSSASNVVSYIAIVDVVNDDERLRPGMTADVSLPGLRRDEVVRIPNTALTFRPTPEMLKALGEADPMKAHGITPGMGPDGKKDVSVRDVWEYDGKRFTPIAIRAGLADDGWTELLSGSVRPGDTLVTKASVRPSRL